MEFLNSNAAAIQTVLVFLLVVITALYAYWTKRILQSQEQTVEEIRRQGEAANRAYVVVRLGLREQVLFELQVTNEGRSAASNLTVTIDRNLYEYGEEKHCLNDLPFFSSATQIMPPGIRYIFGLWSTHQCLGAEKNPLCPTQFTIKVVYESLGTQYVEDWPINLELYFRQMTPPPSVQESLHKVSKELHERLAEIRKALERLASRFTQS